MPSMLSKLTLLCLVSVALAGSSSLLDAYLVNHRKIGQLQPVNAVELPARAVSPSVSSGNWAGAAQEAEKGTFSTITGTFNAPHLTGGNGAAAGIFIGIDGIECRTASLQAGIAFGINDGTSLYGAWYGWYPGNYHYFSGIDIHAGDLIKITVTASSSTSGTAIVENSTTGQKVSQDLSSTHPLCQQSAEWILEDPQTPFPNFGTVTFTDATATGRSGHVYTPEHATIVNIEHNNAILTSVVADKTTLTITYV